MQNRTRLGHLHHERRLTAHEVVARAHAREHAVADADRRCGGGHEAPCLCHEHNQTDLSQDRALARHIRARENHEARIRHEPHVVRNELVPWHHALHNRMPAGRDIEIESVGERGPRVTLASGDVSQRGENVQLRNDA